MKKIKASMMSSQFFDSLDLELVSKRERAPRGKINQTSEGRKRISKEKQRKTRRRLYQ